MPSLSSNRTEMEQFLLTGAGQYGSNWYRGQVDGKLVVGLQGKRPAFTYDGEMVINRGYRSYMDMLVEHAERHNIPYRKVDTIESLAIVPIRLWAWGNQDDSELMSRTLIATQREESGGSFYSGGIEEWGDSISVTPPGLRWL